MAMSGVKNTASRNMLAVATAVRPCATSGTDPAARFDEGGCGAGAEQCAANGGQGIGIEQPRN